MALGILHLILRLDSNHGSFYPNQIAALKILSGDIVGAKTVLQSYFDNQFQDQIVASGEQVSLTRHSFSSAWVLTRSSKPLEAVRTRPFHYRCFNLEAMIVSIEMALWSPG